MKNIKKGIMIDFVNSSVNLIIGKKNLKKYCKKRKQMDIYKDFKTYLGLAIELAPGNYTIYISDDCYKDEIQGVLVHEINHIVTYIIENSAIKCDETRSLIFQYIFNQFKNEI